MFAWRRHVIFICALLVSGPVADQTPSPNTWCDFTFFDGTPVILPHFDAVLIAATQHIHQTLAGHCEFKIGITENPYLRWTNSWCGYARSGDWNEMVLLYAANTGSKHVHDSSGKMETLLIKEFAGLDVGCINRVGAGGECASRSSPHFTYVVWRHQYWASGKQTANRDAEKKTNERTMTKGKTTTRKTETTLKAATKGNYGVGDAKIPPLGCSKCRYLEVGCTECILRRDAVLRQLGVVNDELLDVFR
jgi:hypothetical protein